MPFTGIIGTVFICVALIQERLNVNYTVALRFPLSGTVAFSGSLKMIETLEAVTLVMQRCLIFCNASFP